MFGRLDIRFKRTVTLPVDSWQDLELIRVSLRNRCIIGISDKYATSFGHVSKSLYDGRFIISGAGTCPAMELDGRLYSRVNHCNLKGLRIDADGRIDPPKESLLAAAIYSVRPSIRACVITRSELLYDQSVKVGNMDSSLLDVIEGIQGLDYQGMLTGLIGVGNIKDLVICYGLAIDSVAIKMLNLLGDRLYSRV